MQYGISFIGAGKVAGALCREMSRAGFSIRKIVSESGLSAEALSEECGGEASTSLNFDSTTNIIFVSVPDDRIKEVISAINCHEDTVVAHTSGPTGLDVFQPAMQHTGVFYPLQTFSRNRNIIFKDLPLLIESSDKMANDTLTHIADKLGASVSYIDTPGRKMLHLAAVFVCNFTNHLLLQGKLIAGNAGFEFSILKPLINETFLKAIADGPEKSQTGPAIRADKGTIEKHLSLLSFSPDLQVLYKELSSSIMNYYNKS